VAAADAVALRIDCEPVLLLTNSCCRCPRLETQQAINLATYSCGPSHPMPPPLTLPLARRLLKLERHHRRAHRHPSSQHQLFGTTVLAMAAADAVCCKPVLLPTNVLWLLPITTARILQASHLAAYSSGPSHLMARCGLSLTLPLPRRLLKLERHRRRAHRHHNACVCQASHGTSHLPASLFSKLPAAALRLAPSGLACRHGAAREE
jgi:hypothetical protein